jgi:hypothetical protein
LLHCTRAAANRASSSERDEGDMTVLRDRTLSRVKSSPAYGDLQPPALKAFPKVAGRHPDEQVLASLPCSQGSTEPGHLVLTTDAVYWLSGQSGATRRFGLREALEVRSFAASATVHVGRGRFDVSELEMVTKARHFALLHGLLQALSRSTPGQVVPSSLCPWCEQPVRTVAPHCRHCRRELP